MQSLDGKGGGDQGLDPREDEQRGLSGREGLHRQKRYLWELLLWPAQRECKVKNL